MLAGKAFSCELTPELSTIRRLGRITKEEALNSSPKMVWEKYFILLFLFSVAQASRISPVSSPYFREI